MTKYKKQQKFQRLLEKVKHLISSERKKQAMWTAEEKLDYILSTPENNAESKERWKLLFDIDKELFIKEFDFRMSPKEVENKLGWSLWSEKILFRLPKIKNLDYHPQDYVPALLLEIFYMPMTEHAKGILKTSTNLPELCTQLAVHGGGSDPFSIHEPYRLHADYGKDYPQYLIERHRGRYSGWMGYLDADNLPYPIEQGDLS